MELEGHTRGLNYMQGQGVRVSTRITNRHEPIRKYLANSHRYDECHVGKGNH